MEPVSLNMTFTGYGPGAFHIDFLNDGGYLCAYNNKHWLLHVQKNGQPIA
jgi:hypothetical protein